MKKYFYHILFFTLLIITVKSSAQNFFPLSIGNKYIFKEQHYDDCNPWFQYIRYYKFTISDSIIFNDEIYYKYNIAGMVKYLLYDSLEQKLYVYSSGQKKLGADFNLPYGYVFYSYLMNGMGFTCLGIDTLNIFGENRMHWQMHHEVYTPQYYLQHFDFSFIDGLGFYWFHEASFCMAGYEDVVYTNHSLYSAYINNQAYNPLGLSVVLNTALGDKPINEFHFYIEISVDSDLPDFLDSLYLYYEVERDTSIIYEQQVNFDQTYFTAQVNLDSAILKVGDRVKLKIVVTDSTIFENRVVLPDTGYYTITVLPDQRALELYPLAPGNKWVYNGVFWDQGENYTYKFIRKVNGIITKPNQLDYYEVEEYEQGSPPQNTYFERVDSLSGYVYRYSEDSVQSNYEYLIDDLTAVQGDTVMSFRFFTNFPYTITGEGDTTIFQIPAHYKTYDSNYLVEYQYTLAQNFGLISIYNYFDFGSDIKLLKGAFINGTVYGDTSATAVEGQDQQDLSYSLSQNYPNPFNPETNISYTIIHPGLVTIKVYDVLGNEVAILANEEKSAGSYTVQFDGGKLSSGIYYYKLTSGKFVQAKKMLLLK